MGGRLGSGVKFQQKAKPYAPREGMLQSRFYSLQLCHYLADIPYLACVRLQDSEKTRDCLEADLGVVP